VEYSFIADSVEVMVVRYEGGVGLEACCSVQYIGFIWSLDVGFTYFQVVLLDLDDFHLGDEGVQEGGGGLGVKEFCIACHLFGEEGVTNKAYAWIFNDVEDEAEGSRLSSGLFYGRYEDVGVKEKDSGNRL